MQLVNLKNAGMRFLPVLIALFMIAESCSKKSSCDPNYSTSVFETNKEIKDTTIYFGLDSVQSYVENSGSNLVFKYTFGTSSCSLSIFPTSELLSFQIDPSLTGFEYRDSSLLTAKCYYIFHGEAIRNIPEKISKGIIKGSKLSATKWNITVQLQDDFGSTLFSFSNIFTLVR